MLKPTTFLLLVSLLTCRMYAQSLEGFVTLESKTVPCFYVEISESQDVIRSLIEQKIVLQNVKSKKDKNGYYKYTGIKNNLFSTETVDLYLVMNEVENKNKVTQVSILVSRGYDNFINSGSDKVLAGNALKFLDNIYNDVLRISLQNEVRQQETRLAEEKNNTANIQNTIQGYEAEKQTVQKKIDKLHDDLANQL